jgi:hypothetical protein
LEPSARDLILLANLLVYAPAQMRTKTAASIRG